MDEEEATKHGILDGAMKFMLIAATMIIMNGMLLYIAANATLP